MKSWLYICSWIKVVTHLKCLPLLRALQFEHHVQNVAPKGNGWKVTVKNLLTNKIEVVDFDSVMVCNGWVYIKVIVCIENFIS